VPLMSEDDQYIIGYLDRFSYRPADVVSCMISATERNVSVDVIRLVRGAADVAYEAGYGPKVEAIQERSVEASEQATVCGSYVIARDVIRRPGKDIALSARIWPTNPRGRIYQGLVSLLDDDGRSVFSVGIDHAGVPVVRTGGGHVLGRGGRALYDRRWYSFRVEVDAQSIELRVRPLEPLASEANEDVSRSGGYDPSAARHVLLAAAELRGIQPLAPYDGKLERPVVAARDGLIAEWAFERTPDSNRVEDISGCDAHGVVVNSPTRAMTGSLWDGTVTDPQAEPAHYGSIHFHADDIDDARWTRSVEIPLPDHLSSGIYAVRLRGSSSELTEIVPFVVNRRAASKPPVVLLLPTLSYQAYANLQPPNDAPHPLDPLDCLQRRHPEFGKSLYDEHDDGSGVCMATLARPMLQFRPGYRSWLTGCPRHFSADLFLVEWLEKQGVAFDVVCDHDVDDDPAGALNDYDVVLTGSHPEYCTGRLLAALDHHITTGGRLMYLGGNGFYWVTSRSPANPDVIEVRRYVGTRTWDGEPGEQHHATTAEYGGLWRDRGRAPNRLTGVGMTAQGWDGAVGYRRTAAAQDPRWSWVFEGVTNEVFGDYGFCLGGASGDELDRFDIRRGSPADGVILATSLRHSVGYHAVVEDVLAVEGDLSAATSSRVRSDMVIAEHASGGWSFSVGSISFIGSLMWNDGNNDVSRIVANVLREFVGRGRRSARRD
jgi:N,N-dimethylformamidase